MKEEELQRPHPQGEAAGVAHELAVTDSPQQLGKLLEEYRPYLLAIARQEISPQLAGKVAPSDLVQDTLVRGLQHFETFAGTTREQLAGWLKQILLNRARNAARDFGAEKRDVSREEPVDSRIAVASERSPSREAISRERQERFEGAVARLADELRRVIEWRHREDLTFAEIGRRLDRSEDTARRLWARAIEQLQCELAHDESRHHGTG